MARARYIRSRRKMRVVLSAEVVEELKRLKTGNENYDDVIRRLLREYYGYRRWAVW